MQRNAADAEQIKQAEKKAKLKRDAELKDLNTILASIEGRRFYWKLMAFCRINESSFHPSGSQMYFFEGTRNVGLKLLADLHDANPEAYVTMMKEAEGRKLNGE